MRRRLWSRWSEGSHLLCPILALHLPLSPLATLSDFFSFEGPTATHRRGNPLNHSGHLFCFAARPWQGRIGHFRLNNLRSHSTLRLIYNSFDRVTKFFTRVLFVEKDLGLKTFYLQINNLWQFDVKTDATGLLRREIKGEVLMERPGCDQEQIYPDISNLLPLISHNWDLQKLLPQLVLSHLEIEGFVDSPLGRLRFTWMEPWSSLSFDGRTKHSPSLTLK